MQSAQAIMAHILFLLLNTGIHMPPESLHNCPMSGQRMQTDESGFPKRQKRNPC